MANSAAKGQQSVSNVSIDNQVGNKNGTPVYLLASEESSPSGLMRIPASAFSIKKDIKSVAETEPIEE